MQIIQIIVLTSAVLLTTQATHFRKLITSYGPSVQTQHHVFHSESQASASPPEPAPVFEHTEELHPDLLPPTPLFSIQPVAHYVLPQPFYPLPLLHAGAYATADASAGASAFFLHPQAAYEATRRYTTAKQDIHHQRQSAFYAGAQSNWLQQQQGIPSHHYDFPQQAFDAEAQAQSNAAANAQLQTQQFIQNQYGPPEPANIQTNDAAAIQQQQQPIILQNQFRPQQSGFHDAEKQNFNAAVQDNGVETFKNQLFANQYAPPEEQSLSLQNYNTAQNSAAASSLATSSGQNQQLFTPTASSGKFLPYAAASSASTSSASAHSSSVVDPVSNIASHSASFTTSSSSSSSSNLVTPYTISSASGSSGSSSTAANIADNLIVPSASYGAPQ